MKHRITGALLAALLIAATAGCTLASSKVNETCLVYSGGKWEDAEFVKIMKPGTNSESIGIGSNHYCYPNDQRSYRAGGKGADTEPLVVTAKGDVRMVVPYELYFTLNQREDVIVPFHENLGLKNAAYNDSDNPDGWRQMLQESVEPQINRAIESVALGYDWRALLSSDETRKQFQAAVAKQVKINLKEIIGNDYFCGPGYTGEPAKDEEPTKANECGEFTFSVGKPDPVNEDVIKAVESEQTAVAAARAQEQKNAQIAAQVAGERQLVELWGADNAALLRAIESGKVQTFIIGGEGVVPAVPAG